MAVENQNMAELLPEIMEKVGGGVLFPQGPTRNPSKDMMAEQTGQYGCLFKFDKVNATALHMLLQLHLEMKKNRVKGLIEDRRV